jgi:hypothetical protein
MKILNASSRKIICCILTITLFAFFAASSICAQPKNRDYWPTGGWKSSTPELQGMDSAKLLIADEFIRERLTDAFSLLVVRKRFA